MNIKKTINLLAFLSLGLFAVGCGKKSVPLTSSKNSNTQPNLEFFKGSIITRSEISFKIDDRNGKVTFFQTYKGKKYPYRKAYRGEVYARQSSTNPQQFDLLLQRKRVGLLKGKNFILCGLYNDRNLDFPCEALFLNNIKQALNRNPNLNPADHLTLMINFSDVGGSSSTSQKINLSQYATKQIDQYGTGTCHFNSTIGVYEWYYHFVNKRKVDFSEPAFVAFHDKEVKWDEVGLLQNTNTVSGLFLNRAYPVEKFYNETNEYEDVVKSVKAEGSPEGMANRYKLPLNFKVKTTPLYYYGMWQNGHVTEKDYRKTVQWLHDHHKPVQLFHVINGYWHVVVLLGHDTKTGKVLVKDSLGNRHLKATWRTKKWFMENVYGAIGTDLLDSDPIDPIVDDEEEEEGDTPPTEFNASKMDLTFEDRGELRGKRAIALSLENQEQLSEVKKVTYYIPALRKIYTTSRKDLGFKRIVRVPLSTAEFDVEVTFDLLNGESQSTEFGITLEAQEEEGPSFKVKLSKLDAYKDLYLFSLSIDGTDEDLRLIKEVVYSLKDPKGNIETYSYTNKRNQFRSEVFETDSLGWKSGEVTIHLKDGETYTLEGIKIKK